MEGEEEAAGRLLGEVLVVGEEEAEVEAGHWLLVAQELLVWKTDGVVVVENVDEGGHMGGTLVASLACHTEERHTEDNRD